MHRTFGELAMAERRAAPVRNARPGASCGPELGEHNDEILLGVLGMKPAEIAKLTASGVV